MKKIAIMTTRQNFVWNSMREVFPAIEECWQATSTTSRLINLDTDPLREHIHFLMSCDAIIIIAFNETISRFIIQMRKSLNLQIPFVLHLYGYATLACWPLARFGALECFNENDVFIGTCPGDIKCMDLTFKNAITHNIPYPYVPYEFESRIKVDKKVFAYVGRLSNQKNVDILIKAYNVLCNEFGNNDLPPFYIYGEEDHLGWPNFGIASSNYLQELKKLIDEYNLKDKIFFMGFEERERIYQFLGSDHIFVSASTHSDENFGMAAMRSLSVGGQAVLSAWGGHLTFQDEETDRVELVKVHFDENRPRVDEIEFAEKMKKALKSKHQIKNKKISDYFLSATVQKLFERILDNIIFSDKQLQLTETAKAIHLQQRNFEKLGYKQKAFTGFNDPLVQPFLRAYKG
jgi:glycosyltransferase involved in cell wall biosynthesis